MMDQSQSGAEAGRKKEEKKFKGSEADIKLPQRWIPWPIWKKLLIFFIASTIMPPVTANLEETCKNANVTALSGKDFTCSFQLPVRESVFSTYVLWNSQQLFQHVQNSDEPIHRFTSFTGLKDRRYMTILAGLKDRMNVTILNNGHVSMRIKAARPEDSGTYTFQQVFSDRKPINTSLKINFVNVKSNSSIPENTTIPAIVDTVKSNNSSPDNTTVPSTDGSFLLKLGVGLGVSIFSVFIIIIIIGVGLCCKKRAVRHQPEQVV